MWLLIHAGIKGYSYKWKGTLRFELVSLFAVAPFTDMVHMPSNVWGEIIYSFLNFNSATVEV